MLAAAVLLFTVVMIMLLFSIIQVVANASLFPTVRAVRLPAPSYSECVSTLVWWYSCEHEIRSRCVGPRTHQATVI